MADTSSPATTTSGAKNRPLGIPYARANEDGPGVFCPVCGLLCVGLDESQETLEDALTKGDVAVYGEHYAKEHEEVAR